MAGAVLLGGACGCAGGLAALGRVVVGEAPPRPPPLPRSSSLVGGSPEVGALVKGRSAFPPEAELVLLPVAAVVQVLAVAAVVAGPGAGRAARDEVRSESVAGPEGPATAGAPAPALTAGGAR